MSQARRWGGWSLVVVLLLTVCAACGDDPVRVRHDVRYGTAGPFPLLLDVYSPSDHDPGSADRLAAIVLLHGGGWRQGTKSDVAETARAFARAGFVAIAADYSLPPAGQRFPAEVDDSRAAVRWAQEHASELGIDPARVGVHGPSAGGNLAMMVGATGTGSTTLPPVKAVSSWSGLSDLTVLAPPDGRSHPNDPPVGCAGVTTCIGVATPAVFTEYLGCTLSKCPSRYRAASPITFVRASTPPMFLAAFHDDFVPFDQSRRMADALRAHGITAELREIPGIGHGDSARPHVIDETIAFFERELH
ncbi:MAG: alpha/beta hydrolase [Acidimicrobiia bacterium]